MNVNDHTCLTYIRVFKCWCQDVAVGPTNKNVASSLLQYVGIYPIVVWDNVAGIPMSLRAVPRAAQMLKAGPVCFPTKERGVTCVGRV